MPNPENVKPHEFKKGQSGNPNGRPKKSFASINAELKKKGVTPLTKGALIEAYELVFNTDEKTLVEIAQDKETPYALKIIIMELNNTKTRSKALQDYRDYCFGRATNTTDITSGGDKISHEPVQINFVTTPKEEKSEE